MAGNWGCPKRINRYSLEEYQNKGESAYLDIETSLEGSMDGANSAAMEGRRTGVRVSGLEIGILGCYN